MIFSSLKVGMTLLCMLKQTNYGIDPFMHNYTTSFVENKVKIIYIEDKHFMRIKHERDNSYETVNFKQLKKKCKRQK